MKSNIKILSLSALALSLITLVSSCVKDGESYGVLKVNIEHYADSIPLVFNRDFITADSQVVNITKFNYYITNVLVQAEDGSSFAEPKSYRLITQGDSLSRQFQIVSIPNKTYTGIQFTIGVTGDPVMLDSLNIDDLNPINGMFWNDSMGYYAAKLEGKAPITTNTNREFRHNIASFDGTRTISFKFPNPIVIKDNSYNSLDFTVDVMKWFNGGNKIDLGANLFLSTPSEATKKVADNYATMFTLKSVK